MAVYRLKYNKDHFNRVNISPLEIMDRLPGGVSSLLPGKPIQDNWVELNGDIYPAEHAKSNNLPDLSEWRGRLVLSEALTNTSLWNKLANLGELLPICIEGSRRYIFRPKHITDSIDPFNSKKIIQNGIEMGVEKLAFLEHEIADLGIFVTNYDGLAFMYCNDDIKALFEESQLETGWVVSSELR